MTVIHGVRLWLKQTMTWIHSQVRYLPSSVEAHIVCERVANLDQFGLPRIHCLWETSRARYLWELGLRKLGLRKHLGFLVEQALRNRAQLLHSHFGDVGWANIGAARRAGMRHVVTFYGYDVGNLPDRDPRWHGRYKALFESVDGVLCEGPHMAKSIAALGCPERKLRVHRLGVEVEKIAFRPRAWKPTEPLRVLIAASFQEKKGIPDAMEALGRLQYDLPLEVTVIGDASQERRSQAEKGKILAALERHSLQGRVRMLGYRPHADLLEEAYRHHVFLSPSLTASDGDTEGGAPVTLIEMAATGMPLVSTRHCDIPEIVQHGVTGLLAGERDVKGLIEQLQWLVDHPERWSEMILQARRRVESEFNAQRQGEKLADIYRELVGT